MKTQYGVSLYGLSKLYIGIYIYVCANMYVIIINENEVMNLKDSREVYIEGFGGRRRKGDII